MLLTFTDSISNNSVAINPEYVVAVFTVPSIPDQAGNINPEAGKTVIGLLNGNVTVVESYLDVVGRVQGELS